MQPTIIVALITACAAIIAPVLNTFITRRYECRKDATDILLRWKLNAYNAFLTSAGKFFDNPLSEESVQDFRSAMDHALLLASPDTIHAINAYSTLLLSITPPSFSAEEMIKIRDGHRKLLEAMRKELEQYDAFKFGH